METDPLCEQTCVFLFKGDKFVYDRNRRLMLTAWAFFEKRVKNQI